MGGVKEEGVRVEVWIFGKSVQGISESSADIGGALFQRAKDGHEDFAGFGAGVGLGAEADLSSLDQGAKFAFGKVVFGGDGGGFRPVVEAVRVLAEDVLDGLDGRVLGGATDDVKDGLFDLASPTFELSPPQAAGAELHGQIELVRQVGDKAQDLGFIRKSVLHILYQAQQVRVAVLDLARRFVIPVVSVYNEVTWERGPTEDLLRDRGGPGLAKLEDLKVVGAK